MTVHIVSLAERADLLDEHWHLTELWPGFMLHDLVGDLYFSRLETYAAHIFLALDEHETVVGRALAVPFAMGEHLGRPALPDAGWDGVVRWAWLDSLVGRSPTHVSALEVTITPEHRGSGLAERLLAAMKDSARAVDATAFVAPVRPSRKHHEPRTPMTVYARREDDRGRPVDPWLRLHVRAGGRIGPVCPYSMTIAGSLQDWRAWTGLPLDESGDVEVPGALALLHVDVDQDHGVYVEPNVWVLHDL